MLNTHFSRTLNNQFNDRIKHDAKRCYHYLREHYAIPEMKLTEQYNFYVQFFGAENFSHSCVHGKGDDGDYLTPFTLPIINGWVEDRLSQQLGGRAQGETAYRALAYMLGTITRHEHTSTVVESTLITHDDKDLFLFQYFIASSDDWINVQLPRDAAEQLKQRLISLWEQTPRKRAEDPLSKRYVETTLEETTNTWGINLPRYRQTKGGQGITAYGQTRGTVIAKRDLMLTYMLSGKAIDPALSETLFVDLYLTRAQHETLLAQLTFALSTRDRSDFQQKVNTVFERASTQKKDR